MITSNLMEYGVYLVEVDHVSGIVPPTVSKVMI
jgi:hypothetical protein